MSLKGVFYRYSDINFLTDRLRPVCIINGVDYPLGIFVVTTETHELNNGCQTTEIEAYSLLYLAQRKKIEERVSILSGESYITKIIELLSSCGINDIESEPTNYTFNTNREDWDIGTPVLDIVNQLLNEINYNSAWVNLKGVVKLTPYEPPSISNVQHTYSAGEYSIIQSDYKRTTDRFGKYNVFRVICENPDLSQPMVAISENNSPDSPFSTIYIGRILYVEQVDNIPSQSALQLYADKLKYQSLQETESIEFYTAISPEHAVNDVVALDNGDIAGIYYETEWRLPMSADAYMTHKARRIYIDS